jgi:hypothetical protein
VRVRIDHRNDNWLHRGGSMVARMTDHGLCLAQRDMRHHVRRSIAVATENTMQRKIIDATYRMPTP